MNYVGIRMNRWKFGIRLTNDSGDEMPVGAAADDLPAQRQPGTAGQLCRPTALCVGELADRGVALGGRHDVPSRSSSRTRMSARPSRFWPV